MEASSKLKIHLDADETFSRYQSLMEVKLYTCCMKRWMRQK